MKKIAFKKIKIKKLIKWAVLLLIIVIAAYFFLNKLHPKQAKQDIMTANAMKGRVESVISGNGALSPANQYEVKSLVKGEILKAPFEEGDTVDKGGLLYQISTSNMANSIETAKIGVQKAKNAYKACAEKKDGLVVTSAYSGYIKKLYVKQGETVQAGKTIADIYNGDTMRIDLLFPSREVTKAWIGKTAEVTMDATGEVIKGEVTKVNSMEEVLDGGILAKEVTIKVKNIGGIKTGDSAEASIGTVASINTGKFRPETESSLTAQTEGKIEAVSVKEGQQIQKGDKLLTLSSKDLDSQIEDAAIGVTEAELSLQSQKDQMNQYTIKSPISGKVITKNKKAGDTIDPTSDTQAGPMAIIYDMSYLTFEMNIDEFNINTIKVNQKVSVSSEAFPGDSYEGVIERISLKGNTKNGATAYPVLVKVDKFGKLLPGMNVTGRIIIEEADNVLTVPSSALQRGNIVYVKSAEAVKTKDSQVPEGFKTVTVKTGINDGTNVEIKEGLKEGDIVYVPFNSSEMGMGDGMDAGGNYTDDGTSGGQTTADTTSDDGASDGQTTADTTSDDGTSGGEAEQ